MKRREVLVTLGTMAIASVAPLASASEAIPAESPLKPREPERSKDSCMYKIITFVEAAPGLTRSQFAQAWQDAYVNEFAMLTSVKGNLCRAVHNFISPDGFQAYGGSDVSPMKADITAPTWTGIGSYYFEDVEEARAVLADPQFTDWLDSKSAVISRSTHLLVKEVAMFDKDPSPLPAKIMAFFKRKPEFTRREALVYYNTTHAEVAERFGKDRMSRYKQNHSVESYTNPDKEFDYDGGPECWFKSWDILREYIGDEDLTGPLSEDEEKFVIRNELASFFIDEETEIFLRS
jgi:hypothetical protein